MARGKKGQETRRAILDAAIASFGRDGYLRTTVIGIAREAGVGNSVPYIYFADREAIFLAAVDDEASAVIREGLAAAAERDILQVPGVVVLTAIKSLDQHPLARRLFAGLEPEATTRVLKTPALENLRKTYAELLEDGQREGKVRSEIDPVRAANGIVAIGLSLLMSAAQIGEVTQTYARDIEAILESAVAVNLQW